MSLEGGVLIRFDLVVNSGRAGGRCKRDITQALRVGKSRGLAGHNHILDRGCRSIDR